jgi:hypothetical protein
MPQAVRFIHGERFDASAGFDLHIHSGTSDGNYALLVPSRSNMRATEDLAPERHSGPAWARDDERCVTV